MAKKKSQEPLIITVPKPRLTDDEAMDIFYGGKTSPGIPPAPVLSPLSEETVIEPDTKDNPTSAGLEAGSPYEGSPNIGSPFIGLPETGIPQVTSKPFFPQKLILSKAACFEDHFFPLDNDVEDKLARLQDPYEYIVYRKLWRHSFGSPARLNCCRASYSFLLEGSPFTHRNSIIRAIEGLCRKHHIIRINEPKAVTQAGKLYRVLRPAEIFAGMTAEGIPFSSIPDKGIDIVQAEFEGEEVHLLKGTILQEGSPKLGSPH